jgi:hypothetical protein
MAQATALILDSTIMTNKAEGVSRMTIYRRRRVEQAKNPPNVTGASTPIFLSTEDRPVTSREGKRLSEQGFALKKKKEVIRLADSLMLAADIHATLPLELRMAALCLPLVEYRMAA